MTNINGYTTNSDRMIDGINDFCDYVMSWYGDMIGAIYDYSFTRDEVLIATGLYIGRDPDRFCGDSMDRELVRDIVLNELR